MPSWDNTSRRGKAGNVFQNATPEVFEAWLSVLCAKAQRDLPPGRRLVFVNAWNEWGEGAYLEPDRRNGHRNLKAVRSAQSVRNMLLGTALLPPDELHFPSFRDKAIEVVAALTNANQQLTRFAIDCGGPVPTGHSTFIARPKGALVQVSERHDANCNIDSLNGRHVQNALITALPSQAIAIVGWVQVPGVWQSEELPAFLHLVEATEVGESREYIASILERECRDDVSATFNDVGPQQWYGFRCTASFAGIEPGRYGLRLLIASPSEAHVAFSVSTKLVFYIGRQGPSVSDKLSPE